MFWCHSQAYPPRGLAAQLKLDKKLTSFKIHKGFLLNSWGFPAFFVPEEEVVI
jgi:hypothetical protein